ncbi:MAG: hypothetical protein BZ136_03645 [Methanosphaera sp. rholeuAM74]|nr:MAG: hypothetical protein BZ136_03645 [Methanosphaera sp. rholeuAM74]
MINLQKDDNWKKKNTTLRLVGIFVFFELIKDLSSPSIGSSNTERIVKDITNKCLGSIKRA